MDIFEKNNDMLLGFGIMRIPENAAGDVDTELLGKLADRFMEKGYTYFDTAHTYLGGRAEGAFKTAVADRYPREAYQIATKLPLFDLKTKEEYRAMMDLSLERLGTGYVDFWLIHSLKEETMKRAEDCGVWDLMKEYKASGKAKHIGFSYHDSPELLDAYLDRHPETEFVQLQVNYMDWEDESIRARECCEAVRKHGLPIIIMEPIKGGGLATGNEDVQKLLGGETAASMALRWAAQVDGVKMILSGMNTMEQVEENTAVLKQPKPLTAEQNAAMEKAAEILKSIPRVPCTSCKYCEEGCPQKIRIHWILELYNNAVVFKNPEPVRGTFGRFVGDSGVPSSCLKCGLCESVCPQHLPIPELMENAAKILE